MEKHNEHEVGDLVCMSNIRLGYIAAKKQDPHEEYPIYTVRWVCIPERTDSYFTSGAIDRMKENLQKVLNGKRS